MYTPQQLRSAILRLDGRGYPAYKDLKGKTDFQSFILSVDHVQSDPFASPSDLSIEIPNPGYPRHLYENRSCRIALQDALLRAFGQALKTSAGGRAGSGKSGKVSVSRPGQEVLDRSACQIDERTGSLYMAIQVGFPARGRSILARELVRILLDQLPEIVEKTLIYANMPKQEQQMLQNTYELTCDQMAIRQALQDQHLVAFVANGSLLPRQSGASDLPMKDAVPFQAPKENEIIIDLPYRGKTAGMGIPEGITLIVGGGYHGKSTLLNALEMGVYDHIAQDGRELVITRDDGVKIRAEDGRAVHNDDISGFIQNLPHGRSTSDFVSEDASGSTSQAANVVEALEAGSQLLLIDEDTSATNFMIRDDLMSQVIHASQEPIIPFLARIQDLKQKGVSTILVAGSSGAYFEPADLVLQMQEYEPMNVTEKAHEAARIGARKERGQYPSLQSPELRIPLKNKAVETDRLKVKTQGTDTLTIAREPIDVRYLEQLCDSEQLAAIGKMLVYGAKNLYGPDLTLPDLLDQLETLADEKGMRVFGKGNLARPRRAELAGALSRWRSQYFQQKSPVSGL